jgi:cytochrome oxidase assembly protein ShyY1
MKKIFGVIFLICLALSFWQLKRHYYKQSLENLFLSNQKNILNIEQVKNLQESSLFAKIKFRGKIINKPVYYYAQNRKKQGYYHIAPIILDSGECILANLGWAEKKLSIEGSNSSEEFFGNVMLFPEKKIWLIKNDKKNLIWFFLDKKELEEYFGFTFSKLLINLDQDYAKFEYIPYKFAKKVNHLNYSIMWIVMALISLFFFFRPEHARKDFSNK